MWIIHWKFHEFPPQFPIAPYFFNRKERKEFDCSWVAGIWRVGCMVWGRRDTGIGRSVSSAELGDGVHFSEDASHGERLAGTEMANTEIGVPGGC